MFFSRQQKMVLDLLAAAGKGNLLPHDGVCTRTCILESVDSNQSELHTPTLHLFFLFPFHAFRGAPLNSIWA